MKCTITYDEDSRLTDDPSVLHSRRTGSLLVLPYRRQGGACRHPHMNLIFCLVTGSDATVRLLCIRQPAAGYNLPGTLCRADL